MRANEFITEGREGFLYHGMELDKAVNVLSNDTMPAQWEHTIPGLGKVRGNSFSRNPKLRWGWVTLTVDHAKLAQNNRIIPLDAEYVQAHRGTDPKTRMNLHPDISDRSHAGQWSGTKKKPDEFLQEEFVVGDIKNLHKKIVMIKLIGNPKFLKSMNDPTKQQFKKMANLIKKYAETYNIKYNIDPRVS